MTNGRRPRLALAYAQFGPYHLARWRHLAATAADRGWDVVAVELLAAQDRYRWDPNVGPVDDQIIRLALPSDGRDQVRWQDAAVLLRRIAGLRPDVVAVNGWVLRDSLLLHAWCRARRVARVVVTDTTGADAPRTRPREAAKRVILADVGAAFTAGAASRRYAAGLGVPAARITDGCDVVDNAHFAAARTLRRADPAGRVRLVTVARLIPEKNLLAAAAAFTRIVRDDAVDATWTIAGYGPLEHELRRTAEAAGGRIRLLGAVGHTDLPRVYAEADVLWLPSRSEPWGLVVNEAMAAGLPVAVSDRVGCREDLVTAATGWTFPPGTVDDLADGLRRVLADRARWVAMGVAAADLVAAWDVDRFSRGLLDAADLALGARRPRHAGR